MVNFRCGSGLSGECLTEQGHMWVGMDISPSMLGKNATIFFTFIVEYFFMLNFVYIYQGTRFPVA